MSSERILKNRRNKYKKIEEDKRMEIIERIINKGEPLKNVADDTGVNISTCKAILKVYQDEGRIGKKKTRNKVVEVIETYSFYCLEDCSLTQICPMKIESGKISVGHDEDIDEIIKAECKNKGQKFLKEAMETREKVMVSIEERPRGSQDGTTDNSNQQYPQQPMWGYMPMRFYQP